MRFSRSGPSRLFYRRAPEEIEKFALTNTAAVQSIAPTSALAFRVDYCSPVNLCTCQLGPSRPDTAVVVCVRLPFISAPSAVCVIRTECTCYARVVRRLSRFSSETVRGHSETGVSRKRRSSAATFDRVTESTVDYRCASIQCRLTGRDGEIGFITVGRPPAAVVIRDRYGFGRSKQFRFAPTPRFAPESRL